MRKVLLYLLLLAAAAAAVFLAAYFFGRHPSLEAELERLTAPRPAPVKTGGIPSLRPQEPPAQIPAAGGEPAPEEPAEGVRLRRSALGEPGAVIVADLGGLAAAAAAAPPETRSVRAGLEAFLAASPAGLRVGLRSLESAGQECGSTALLRAAGLWGGGELQAALANSGYAARGPRNPARAVQEAAADLEAAGGGRAVILLAGGPEECGADLCGESPAVGPATPRIHVIVLPAAAPPAAPEGTAPADAGQGAAPPAEAPGAEAPWVAPYRCLAERSGGSVAAALGAEDLEARLRGLARSLEAAILVRATHLRGEEVQGPPPESGEGWGVSLSPRDGTGEESAARVAAGLPGLFPVPAGSWEVRCWYGSLEKSATVSVAPGERAELVFAFTTGELFVQAEEPGGKEIVGDSAAFGCAWGAEILPADRETPIASTCSFPARFELPPGSYRLRARWKGQQRLVEEIGVEGGESTVCSLVFDGQGE